MRKYLFIFTSFLLTVNLSVANSVNVICDDVIEQEVTAKEFISKGSSYRELKDSLIKQALLDSVKQALGTDIRSNSGMTLSSIDGSESESFRDYSMEKAKGYIKSYKVLTEDIETMGSMDMLVIKVHAQVCNPPKDSIRDIVIIDSDDHKVSSVLSSRFPENKYFTLALGNAGTSYHDIRIVGTVLESDVRKKSEIEAENLAEQAEAAKNIVGSLLGVNLSRLSLGGSGLGKQTAIVTVLVEASLLAEQEKISETVTEMKEIPIDIDDLKVREDLTILAFEKAASILYQKLLHTYDSSLPIPTKPKKISQKPSSGYKPF